ncbi:MAG TPA: hypothetical protein VEI02_05245, partial [Planctomycetota bacterium]|nr:hypothetical protein [Planctomycetota bacterium]
MRTRWIVVLAAGLAACASGGDARVGAPGALSRRGEAALAEGRADEAKALFLQAAASEDPPFWAWIGLGRVATTVGDDALFDRSVAEAMRLAPADSPAASDALGKTFLAAARRLRPPDRRQAALALSYFQRVAKQAPETPALRYHTGLAAWAAGDEELALAALEADRLRRPDDGATLRALLDLYRSRGDRRSVART